MNNCGTKYKLIELLNAIENTFFCECQKDKLKDLFIDIFNDENLFVVFTNKIDEVKKLLKKDLSFFKLEEFLFFEFIDSLSSDSCSFFL